MLRPNGQNQRSFSASGHRRGGYGVPTAGQGQVPDRGGSAAQAAAAYSKHREIVSLLARRPNSAFGHRKRVRPVTPQDNAGGRRERMNYYLMLESIAKKNVKNLNLTNNVLILSK